MADEKPKEEVEPKIPYKDLHATSMKGLLAEKPPVDAPKAKEPEVIPAASKSPLDEAKELVEKQKEEARQIAKSAAEEASQKTKDELSEEIRKIQQETTSKKDKEVAERELKSKWKEEGRNPKDYDEIFESAAKEGEERGFERAKKFYEEQEAAKLETQNKETKAREDEEKTKKELEGKYLEQVNKRITDELEELYVGNYIPRPKDDNDPTEVKNKLINQGIKINQERLAAGQAPIDSIAKIFFMHYKEEKPAGADAPIAGATTTTTPVTNEGYNYAKDHGKSYRQIAAEARKTS